MKTVKYFTKALLIQCATKAHDDGWNFNRQLSQEYVGALPDFNFPVVFEMDHHYRVGVECELHKRCVVAIFKDLDVLATCKHLIVDIPMSFYEDLPSAEVEETKKM